MTLDDFKLVYVIVCLGLSFIILSPTLAMVVKLPSGEEFSELWLLGPGHMTEDYPFNISAGTVYKVYLGVGSHMKGLSYYLVYVKFRNETEPVPDSLNGTPSILEPICEYRMVLSTDEIWEKEIYFTFEDVTFDGNLSKVGGITIDGSLLNVDKICVWDQENNGFYYQMFFELWLYNSATSSFQFHNRFVSQWMNVTRIL